MNKVEYQRMIFLELKGPKRTKTEEKEFKRLCFRYYTMVGSAFRYDFLKDNQFLKDND